MCSFVRSSVSSLSKDLTFLRSSVLTKLTNTFSHFLVFVVNIYLKAY